MRRSISGGAERRRADGTRSTRGDATHAAEPQPIADNRPQTIVQRQLVDAVHASPRVAAQRERVASLRPGSPAQAVATGGEDWYPTTSIGPVGQRVASMLSRAESDGGAPLDRAIRRRAENTLGVELDGVRVHTGRASQDAAAAVRARAYTVGQNIHFGAGFYRPGSAEGERLIAHELVHTVQQRGSAGGGVGPSLAVSAPGDRHEREADALASRVTGGLTARGGLTGGATPVPVVQSALAIQRTPLSAAEDQFLIDSKTDAFITAFETHYSPLTLDDHTKWTQKQVAGLWKILEKLPDDDVKTMRKITKTIYAQFFTGTEFEGAIGSDVPAGVGYAVPYVKNVQEQIVGLGFDGSDVPDATMHEVGHTVDYTNKIMKAHMADAAFGSWKEEGTESELDATLSGLTTEKLAELKEKGSEAGNPEPWSDNDLAEHTHGGRVYVLPYRGNAWGWTLSNKWFSYAESARSKITWSNYAFRSPIEWFAEAYQAYYTGVTAADGLATTDKPRHGGGALRKAIPAAAAILDAIKPSAVEAT